MRRLTATLTAVALPLTLAACGDKKLDSADLEGKLKEQLGADAGVQPKAVECPDDVTIEKGKKFNCTLTAPNDDKVRVEVTLTDDEGGFSAVVPPQ